MITYSRPHFGRLACPSSQRLISAASTTPSITCVVPSRAINTVRGLRINLYSPGKAVPGRLARDFADTAKIANTMGWHVEVIAPIATLAEASRLLVRTDATVVIDHYGVYGKARPDSAVARILLEMLELPHVWMKLSAPYRVSDDPLDTKPDPAWLAAILERARERCVWGSDWPHTPAHDAQHGPDAAGVYRPLPYQTLVDEFTRAVGSGELSDMILSDNPTRLYGFGD